MVQRTLNTKQILSDGWTTAKISIFKKEVAQNYENIHKTQIRLMKNACTWIFKITFSILLVTRPFLRINFPHVALMLLIKVHKSLLVDIQNE